MSWWATVWSSAMGVAFSEAQELETGAALARRSSFASPEVAPGSVTLTDPAGAWIAHIGMQQLDDGQWETLVRSIAADPQLTAAVIVGELPTELHGRAVALGCSLAPEPRDVAADCTCGGWREPCRHVGALSALVADLIAEDPWLFTMLRGRTRDQLVEAVRRIRAGQRGIALPEASDEPRGSDAGVAATPAFQASVPPLPPPLMPLRRAASPVAFRPPPADAGVRMGDLYRLVDDAAERAFSLLNGIDDDAALLIEPTHDLARLAATVIDDQNRLDELAGSSGVSADDLRRSARAWLVGGAEGVDVASGSGASAQDLSEMMATGADALAPWGTVRVSGNAATVGGMQLRVDQRGLWWRFTGDAQLGWTLSDGPSNEVSDLLD